MGKYATTMKEVIRTRDNIAKDRDATRTELKDALAEIASLVKKNDETTKAVEARDGYIRELENGQDVLEKERDALRNRVTELETELANLTQTTDAALKEPAASNPPGWESVEA